MIATAEASDSRATQGLTRAVLCGRASPLLAILMAADVRTGEVARGEGGGRTARLAKSLIGFNSNASSTNHTTHDTRQNGAGGRGGKDGKGQGSTRRSDWADGGHGGQESHI